jgi:hypothetical protein
MASNPNKAADTPDLADLRYRTSLGQRRASNPSGSTLPQVDPTGTAGGRYQQRRSEYKQSGAGTRPVPPEFNAVDRTRDRIKARRQQMG